MTPEIWLAVGGVFLAGLLQGLFAVPMKYTRQWSFENTWLAYSLSGMVALPWLLTALTVPHLSQAYAASSAKTLLSIAGFGMCWGIGSTLTGIGLSMLGLGLGMAIILGLCASVGSLIPLLVLTPQQINTPQGRTYLMGTAIMLAGIAISARAGVLRDAARNQTREASGRTSFWAGFFVCCLSGLLSSALNFSYAFGGEAVRHAVEFGTSSLWATGVVTALRRQRGICCQSHLLRLSVVEEPYAPQVRGRRRRDRLALWRPHGHVLVWRPSPLRSRGFTHGKSWSSHRVAFAHGNDHRHQQRSGVITGEWNGVSVASKRFLARGMVTILIALGVLAVAQRAS